jgi:hypothetical protein
MLRYFVALLVVSHFVAKRIRHLRTLPPMPDPNTWTPRLQ